MPPRQINSDEDDEFLATPEFITIKETPRKLLSSFASAKTFGSLKPFQQYPKVKPHICISSSQVEDDHFDENHSPCKQIHQERPMKRRLVKLQDLQSSSSSEDESQSERELLNFINNSLKLSEIDESSRKYFASRPFSSLKDIKDLDKVLPVIEQLRELEKFRKVAQKCENSFRLLSLKNSGFSSEKSENPSKSKEPASLIVENHSPLILKEHQIYGVSWMYNLYANGLGGILADEMGLGKTIQVISFISHLIDTKTDYGPFLVICPASVLSNWFNEFQRWASHLKVEKYHGSLNERFDLREVISNGIVDVLLTTYSMATSSKEDKRFLKRLDPSIMFVDEGHFLKNHLSQKYLSITAIPAKQRILITGTPLQNDLLELFSLLQFITPEKLDVDFELLKELFSSNSSNDTMKISKIKKIIEPFVLRRKKSNVLQDMPSKKEIIIYCSMNSAQEQLIKDLQDKNFLSSVNIVNNINIHLRKAICHPLMFRREYSDESLMAICGKLVGELEYSAYSTAEELFKDLCHSISDYEIHVLCKQYPKRLGNFCLPLASLLNCDKIEKIFRIYHKALQNDQTSKFLIFSQFITILDILGEIFTARGIKFCRLDGSTPVSIRQNLMDDFNSDPEIKIFLLSSKAAGFGINLCTANHVIMYDIDYNPQNDRQAEDRCHRIGQTKDVHVYKLITQGSVEEKALDIAAGKIALDNQFH